jgi:hypothetical protein
VDDEPEMSKEAAGPRAGSKTAQVIAMAAAKKRRNLGRDRIKILRNKVPSLRFLSAAPGY